MVQIKIYPAKHTKDRSMLNKPIQIINEARFDSDLNVPLCYINLDYSKYNLIQTIQPDFLKADANKNISMTPILPGEIIPDTSRFVFNKFEEQVDASGLYKKIGNEFYFTPTYEFVPYNFSYSVTIKRNMTYHISNKYNINIGCFDDADSYDLSSRLSEILVNPADRKLVPPNISINNNKENLYSFANWENESNLDFMFFETHDGKYADENKTQEINISEFLDKNINVWIGCDTHHQYRHKNEELGYSTFNQIGAFKEFELKRSLLSTNTFIKSNVYFNLNRAEYINQTGKNIYNLFVGELSPVLIIEHIGKGFEIISHNDVLKNPKEYKDLIYEVMMYVYLISYKKSKRVDEWITYSIPDYEVINGNLYAKSTFSAHQSLNEILNEASPEYSVYQIDFYNKNKANELPIPDQDLIEYEAVSCTDISNNRLIFKLEKTGQGIYNEMEKPANWVSVYKDGKIYYMDRIYYYIESDITNKIFVVEKDNDLLIKLYPFKSSKYNINIKTDKNVSIKDFKTDVNGIIRAINEEYIIYYHLKEDKLLFSLKDNYEEDNVDYIKIMDLKIEQEVDNTFLSDMRQLGGGLIKEAKDDYDLLDIGHINGRPYRQSNTLIITMPKKYEPYKDKIQAAINKYKVAEDYLVLFFEDEEE